MIRKQIASSEQPKKGRVYQVVLYNIMGVLIRYSNSVSAVTILKKS